MQNKRRKSSPTFKSKVALAAVKGDMKMTELFHEYFAWLF